MLEHVIGQVIITRSKKDRGGSISGFGGRVKNDSIARGFGFVGDRLFDFVQDIVAHALFLIVNGDLRLPLKLLDMSPVGNYAYTIKFSDGHDTGIYTFALLRELGRESSG